MNWTAKDWFHNNSVDYNPAQNTLTVSGRHQDAVAVIDYDTQKLIAIIGSPEGWSEEMQDYFLTPEGGDFEWQWAQHAATWLDDQHIMMFDNGMYRSKTEENAVKAEDNYSGWSFMRWIWKARRSGRSGNMARSGDMLIIPPISATLISWEMTGGW